MKRRATCATVPLLFRVVSARTLRRSAMRRFTSGVLHRYLALIALGVTTTVHAHPEIDAALTRLQSAIAAAPARAELYLERGQLYARHEAWDLAEANYLRAAELARELPGLAHARGALALARGQWREAHEWLSGALVRDAGDAESWVLRARASTGLGDRAAARRDYDRALDLLPEPGAELFLERAACAESPTAELRVLDVAIVRIGPALVLQARALALEESLGRTDAALARLEQIMQTAERRDPWFQRRGEILACAGRDRDAREAFAAALSEIEKLPDWLRAAPATAAREIALRRILAPGSHSS